MDNKINKDIPKKYNIIYSDKTFCGTSATVGFKNGKSILPITDPKKVEMFKKLGYEVEEV